MNVLLRPVSIALFFVALIAFAIDQIGFGILFLVGWFASVATASMIQSSRARAEDPDEVLDPESRTLYLPIRRLRQEIEELAEKHRSMPTVSLLGPEAVREAERIQDQAVRALQARAELRRSLRERSAAQAEIERLREREASAATPEERQSLESARHAREIEVQGYAQAESALSRIETGLRQAQAALTEIKSRLAVAASREQAEAAEDEGLRDSIGRLRALSLTIDETQEMLGHEEQDLRG
jgi:hypothetical protein